MSPPVRGQPVHHQEGIPVVPVVVPVVDPAMQFYHFLPEFCTVASNEARKIFYSGENIDFITRLANRETYSIMRSDSFRRRIRPIISDELMIIMRDDQAVRKVREKVMDGMTSDIKYQGQETLRQLTSKEEVLRSYKQSWQRQTDTSLQEFSQERKQALGKLDEECGKIRSDLQGSIIWANIFSTLAIGITALPYIRSWWKG